VQSQWVITDSNTPATAAVIRRLMDEAINSAATPVVIAPMLATRVPSDMEISWIRQLTEGPTVGQLAEHAGYPERMMFRLLRELTNVGVWPTGPSRGSRRVGRGSSRRSCAR
jgi:hypothetical protein